MALLQLLELLVGVALVRGFELQRLFGLRDPRALVVELRLRIAELRFERRQRIVLRGGVVFGERGLLVGHRARFLGFLEPSCAFSACARHCSRCAFSAAICACTRLRDSTMNLISASRRLTSAFAS